MRTPQRRCGPSTMPATDSLAGTKIAFRLRLLSSLALLPCGCAPLHAQTASQGGMRSGDAIRCASGKPQPAIVACTNIVNDKHESDEARAIALRNRAYQFQQAGDPDHAMPTTQPLWIVPSRAPPWHKSA